MLDDLLDEATFAAGITFIVFGGLAFWRTRRFIARCRTAEGRVTGYKSEVTDEGLSYYPEMRFADLAGVEHELPGSSALQEPPEVGAVVSVTYDPAYPGNAWVTGSASPWVIPWIVVLVGVAFVIGGFVVRAESS